MAQITLDDPQIDAHFQQVSGIGVVAQRMYGGLFLDTACGQHRFEGTLHAAGMDGLCCLWLASTGKESLGMTVALPLLVQQGQCCGWERNTALFGPPYSGECATNGGHRQYLPSTAAPFSLGADRNCKWWSPYCLREADRGKISKYLSANKMPLQPK